MKKIISVMLIIGSISAYTYEKTEKIENEMKKIDKTEEKNLEKTFIIKEKLEEELENIQSDYNIRDEKVEKLKVDSKVRWNRNEYKKILKKYNKVQNEEENIINQKNKELAVIDEGLSIINKNTTENINQEVSE